MIPELWTTIEYAEADDPSDTTSLYVPLQCPDGKRYLAVRLNADPAGINNGWVSYQPVVQRPIDVTVEDKHVNNNPAIVVDSM